VIMAQNPKDKAAAFNTAPSPKKTIAGSVKDQRGDLSKNKSAPSLQGTSKSNLGRSGSVNLPKTPSIPSAAGEPNNTSFSGAATYTPGMKTDPYTAHRDSGSLSGTALSPRGEQELTESMKAAIAAQAAQKYKPPEKEVKETMMLKLKITEGKMSKKPKDTKTKPTQAGVKGYYCLVDIVNAQKQVAPGIDFRQKTKPVDSKFPTWNASFVFKIPRATLGSTHQAMFITIGKMDGKSKVAKQIGAITPIILADIAETGTHERVLPFVNEPSKSITVQIGWWGSGQQNEKAKEDLLFATMKVYTEEDVKRIAQQIISLGQDVAKAQDALDAAKAVTKPYEDVLSKYFEVDDSVRELVNPPIRQSISNPKTNDLYLNLKDDATPQKVAEFILENENLDRVTDMMRIIKAEDSKWKKDFILRDGLENIVKVLSLEPSRQDNSLYVKEAQLASIIKVLLDDNTLCEEIVLNFHEPFTKAIKICLKTKNLLMKAQMLTLLSALCIYGQLTHKFVATAVLAADDGAVPFGTLTSIIKTERDREIITNAMMLVNTLLAGERDLGARIKMRKNFHQAELLSVIQKLREKLPDEKPLMMQFDTFKFMSESDGDELKLLSKIGTLDLFDPISVYNQLSNQVAALDQRQTFLRHLQHLLLVPNITENTKDAWTYIERSSRRAISPTEKEAQGELTIHQLNKQYKSVLSDKINRLQEWNANKPPPPQLPPGARKKHGISDDVVAALPNAAPTESKVEVEYDPTIPEPQRKMKGFYWTGKLITQVENKDYWGNVIIPMEELDVMFQDLQDRFYQPKSASKKEKISLLTVPVANAISIWRAQFPHSDNEAIINDIFDIENSFGTIFTYHFEALLSALPDEKEWDQLRAYDGNLKELESADQFVICLLKVPRLQAKLYNMIFWDEFELRKTCLEDMLAKMIEGSNRILNNPKLLKVAQMVISVSNYLFTPGKTGRQAGQRGGGPGKTEEATSNKPSPAMLSYLSGFIIKNFGELYKSKEDIFAFEEAYRFQPNTLWGEISEIETGLAFITQDLDYLAEFGDEPRFDAYYNAMTQFKEYAHWESERILETFDQYAAQAGEILVTFGKPACQNPIQDLWGQFYLFCRQFKTHIESLSDREEEASRRANLTTRQNRHIEAMEKTFVAGGTMTVGDGEGSLDALITSIRQGSFLGLNKST